MLLGEADICKVFEQNLRSLHAEAVHLGAPECSKGVVAPARERVSTADLERDDTGADAWQHTDPTARRMDGGHLDMCAYRTIFDCAPRMPGVHM